MESKLVCLLAPEGCTEKEILKHWGSQSIIGYEQFQLIRRHSGIPNIVLFEKNTNYNDNDILLIMMCLPVTNEETLHKFRNILYYFDDMGPNKATQKEYASRFEKVDMFISPLKSLANEMNERRLKPSHYIPWSMTDIDFPIKKTETPSVFIDMDDRSFTADSIQNGYELARFCLRININVHAFEKYAEYCPGDLFGKINYVPRTGHTPFIQFLSTMWFYASGIRGSYEYSVLESAMLGCGLISIKSAIKSEHMNRSFSLIFDEEDNFSAKLAEHVQKFDAKAIIADARKIYPQDGSTALKTVLEAFIK